MPQAAQHGAQSNVFVGAQLLVKALWLGSCLGTFAACASDGSPALLRHPEPGAASRVEQRAHAPSSDTSAPAAPSSEHSISALSAVTPSDPAIPATDPEELFTAHPFHEPLPGGELLAKAPARTYSTLSPSQCRTELRRRSLSAQPAPGPTRGVATPLRFKGPLRGVRFVAPGARSVYGTLDCRLLLALHDFAELLERHEVSEVHIDNLYRPQARLPGRRSKRSQHAYGLAVDIRAFVLRDGRVLRIEQHWLPTLKTPPCGPESRLAEQSDDAIMLRNIVCAAAREGLFHHLLTPNYDAAHEDHLHFDIKRDARGVVVR